MESKPNTIYATHIPLKNHAWSLAKALSSLKNLDQKLESKEKQHRNNLARNALLLRKSVRTHTAKITEASLNEKQQIIERSIEIKRKCMYQEVREECFEFCINLTRKFISELTDHHGNLLKARIVEGLDRLASNEKVHLTLPKNVCNSDQMNQLERLGVTISTDDNLKTENAVLSSRSGSLEINVLRDFDSFIELIRNEVHAT